MNELVEKESYELLTDDDVEFLLKYDEYKKRAKVLEDRIKTEAEKFLDEHELTEYRRNGVYIHKTRPYTKKQLDIQSLKDQGIYDLYLKDVDVKRSIRIDIEYDD